MRKIHRWAALGLAAGIVLTGGAVAYADSGDGDQPRSLVEDFAYPGAAQVQAARKVTLSRGDGHIVLADCGADPVNPPADLIAVQSLSPDLPDPNFCFKATGSTGFLQLEIPDAYFVRGENARTISAKVRIADATPVVETEQVDPGEWQPVGVGQSRGSATVLELRFPYAG